MRNHETKTKGISFLRNVALKNFAFGLNSGATSNGPFLKGREKPSNLAIRNSFKTNI
jgi:hypothetical protein